MSTRLYKKRFRVWYYLANVAATLRFNTWKNHERAEAVLWLAAVVCTMTDTTRDSLESVLRLGGIEALHTFCRQVVEELDVIKHRQVTQTLSEQCVGQPVAHWLLEGEGPHL